MGEFRLHKLGTVKKKKFEESFDELVDKYKKMAADGGYQGELKFIQERGKVIAYVTL